MDCIESTLALYVPYDFSLHQQLTALESYGLRYITPLLTLVVLPIAMRIKWAIAIDTREEHMCTNWEVHLYSYPLSLSHFLLPPSLPSSLPPSLLPPHTRYHSHSWYGVWTLLLLMYARAVETSASLLFCPTLTNITNQSAMVGHDLSGL